MKTWAKTCWQCVGVLALACAGCSVRTNTHDASYSSTATDSNNRWINVPATNSPTGTAKINKGDIVADQIDGRAF